MQRSRVDTRGSALRAALACHDRVVGWGMFPYFSQPSRIPIASAHKLDHLLRRARQNLELTKELLVERAWRQGGRS
jgi:hypothetical protein